LAIRDRGRSYLICGPLFDRLLAEILLIAAIAAAFAAAAGITVMLLVTAPLPAGIDGHFGPELRRLVLAQYHQGQMTVPRLVTLLRSLGIFISKRQVVRLLNPGQGDFLAEAREVLRAGLSSADWIHS